MGRLKKDQQKENERILVHVRQYRLTEDQGAFSIIVAALDGYLQHLVYRKFFFVAGCNSDDIYQEALVALATKAIPDYDEEKGPFLSFAKLCIQRHIITILKSANSKRNGPLNGAVSLDQPVSDNEGDEDGPASVGGFMSDAVDRVTGKMTQPQQDALIQKLIKAESFKKMREVLLSKLTPLEMQVFGLYLKNMSYVDIVKFMNKRRRGRGRVDCKTIDNALCRVKKKALDLLRSHPSYRKRKKLIDLSEIIEKDLQQ
jgi:RNA polymerase sporulation-specific sigma factor